MFCPCLLLCFQDGALDRFIYLALIARCFPAEIESNIFPGYHVGIL